MVDEVKDLKPKIISDLKEKGFNVIDMGNGTFDLYVDLDKRKGCFIELKLVSSNYKPWATKSGKKGFNLSAQTPAIRSMKNLPIVFGCDKDDIESCYLILPEEFKEFVNKREKQPEILIGSKHLDEKYSNISYDVALNELMAYLNRIQQ